MIGILFCLTLQAWCQDGQIVRLAEGDAVTLRAHSQGARSFVWYRNSEPILHEHEPTLIVSDAGVYTVIALGEGCDSDLSDPVEVIIDQEEPPAKSVDMSIRNQPNRNAVLKGQPVSYQIITSNNSEVRATKVKVVVRLPREVAFGQIAGNYSGVASYDHSQHEIVWNIPVVEAGQHTTLDVMVRAEQEGSATQVSVVSSQEEDRYPADNQHTSTIEVVALKIPNVFTPNGDGVNDYFVISGLEFMTKSHLIIFNRYGNQVYRNTDYQNNWNGSDLLSGVYFYILEVRLPDGKEQVFKGHVTIMK